MPFDPEYALEIIHKIVGKAIGCTEPAAIAYATAMAYQIIPGEVQSIVITLDKNAYKNAMAVGVPGSGEKGPAIAAALSTVCGDPKKGLLVLGDVTKKDVAQAKQLLSEHRVTLKLNKDVDHLYVLSEVTTTAGTASVLIECVHDRIGWIKKNGETIFTNTAGCDTTQGSEFLADFDCDTLTIEDILKTTDDAPHEKLTFLKDCLQTNVEAAHLGLEKTCGMQLGVSLRKMIQKGDIENTPINHIKAMVAAAVDARMGGLVVPICTCAGSGNHGITYFLTIGLGYEYLPVLENIPLEKTLAFGLIILAMIKKYTGLLTPACGCAIAAGAAASAALTYALGGTSAQILGALNLVAGNIAGLVCDGAKYGCALKISTSSEVAIESALLAMHNTTIPASDGVIGKTLNETLQNVGTLHKHGMRNVDETILDILLKKDIA